MRRLRIQKKFIPSLSLPSGARAMRLLSPLLLVCLASLSIAADSQPESIVAEKRNQAVRSSLVGKWTAELGKAALELTFDSDGRFLLNGEGGDYSLQANLLKFKSKERESDYKFELAGNQLTLSGDDLGQPLKFYRQLRPSGWLSGLSAHSMKAKLYRILTALAIVIVSVLVIRLIRAISSLMIYSDWGPLRALYKRHRGRVRTVHVLLLNLLKYVIYLIAFGFILGELGVNLSAYVASLSLIGFAVGFGSQGLVQDMVTGFFLIFEEQFDVGDMVELSGQVGIVQELGLRMTRLRNYLGEIVVVPNRNIAMVGRFAKGGQEAYVDVAAPSSEAAARAGNVLGRVAEEISKQFQGVILTRPKVLGVISLETGEHFTRLHTSFWPREQWVIEQQLVPRIREALKRDGFELPQDRVVVFYLARKQQRLPTWFRRITRTRRPAAQGRESETA